MCLTQKDFCAEDMRYKWKWNSDGCRKLAPLTEDHKGHKGFFTEANEGDRPKGQVERRVLNLRYLR
jgi:hypothetical protein